MRDADEIARRERLWEKAIEEIEYETGRQVAAIPPREFRQLFADRVELALVQAALIGLGAARAAGVSSGRAPARRPGRKELPMTVDSGFLNRLRSRGEEVLTQVSAELMLEPALHEGHGRGAAREGEARGGGGARASSR